MPTLGALPAEANVGAVKIGAAARNQDPEIEQTARGQVARMLGSCIFPHGFGF
jgi:hypothetical protein